MSTDSHQQQPDAGELHARFTTALRIARLAGARLLHHQGRLTGVTHKGQVDLVSEADKEAESLLVEAIRADFPRDDILAEEGGERQEAARPSGYRWIIDPLDGTTNYVHGFPSFAVSIGLELDGQMVAGIIHAPALGETFTGFLGGGAFLNARPVRVSCTRQLDQALLGTGFPYNRREVLDTLLGELRKALRGAQGVRRMGTAALDLAYVACGRLDGYWEHNLNPWDVAAGVLLVAEAGGSLTGFRCQEIVLDGREMVASNGLIHQELCDTLFA